MSSESDPEEDVPEAAVTPPAPALVAPTIPVRPARRRRSPVVVTSKTLVQEHRTVPYEVYVGISREYDFLRGQNYELRRLVDSLSVGPSRGMSAPAQAPDFSARIRALTHIAAQRLGEMVPEIDDHGAGSSAGSAAEMAQLTRWLIDEMRALEGQELLSVDDVGRISPVQLHVHIVDHDFVRVWLFCILLGVISDVFPTVVYAWTLFPYFLHLLSVLLHLFLFLSFTSFSLLTCCFAYLSYHISCCIFLHILHSVISLID